MTLDDYMLTVFCLVDDQLTTLHLDHVRQRGFAPQLADSEVLTIELIGEFLGFDQDAQVFWYFRQHHADAFPGCARSTERPSCVRLPTCGPSSNASSDTWRAC